MSRPDVFITGIGLVTPAGIANAIAWPSLLAGTRSVRAMPKLSDALGWPVSAGPVPLETPDPHREPGERACTFAVLAARQALSADAMAAGTVPSDPPEDLQISIATNKPLFEYPETLGHCASDNTSNTIKILDRFLSGSLDAPALTVARWLDRDATCHVNISACSTGTDAVLRGAELIQDGDAGSVLAGGSDASVQPLWLAAYDRMGVLGSSLPDQEPAFACRPFDRTRNGFVVGEGAGILMLETAERAGQRKARPIARLAGWARGTDTSGLTQLDPTGAVLAHVITTALDRAACAPCQIGAVIAHGTGTEANDQAEARAIRTALGGHAERIPVVSVKGAIGHLLGAAGAVECALACLACRDQRCMGNATLQEMDSDLGPINLPTEAFELQAPAVLKTSLGFGGHVSVAVFMPI